MLVRKAEECEIPQIRRLFETVYGATFSGQIPDFSEVTKGEQIYVAILDEQIAGMATVWEPDCFIHFLFVDESFRHRKVGSTLVDALAEIYDRPLTLKCLTSNKSGMAFYRATGWQEMQTGISDDGEIDRGTKRRTGTGGI